MGRLVVVATVVSIVIVDAVDHGFTVCMYNLVKGILTQIIW